MCVIVNLNQIRPLEEQMDRTTFCDDFGCWKHREGEPGLLSFKDYNAMAEACSLRLVTEADVSVTTNNTKDDIARRLDNEIMLDEWIYLSCYLHGIKDNVDDPSRGKLNEAALFFKKDDDAEIPDGRDCYWLLDRLDGIYTSKGQLLPRSWRQRVNELQRVLDYFYALAVQEVKPLPRPVETLEQRESKKKFDEMDVDD